MEWSGLEQRGGHVFGGKSHQGAIDKRATAVAIPALPAARQLLSLAAHKLGNGGVYNSI